MENSKEQQLFDACRNGDVETVKQLIEEEGVCVNCKNKYGYTAIMFACNNNIELVKYLLRHPDININYQDIFGYTALIRACYWNHVQPVKELLKHPKIDLSLKDNNGKSAYDLAKRKGNKEIMFLLKTHKLKQTIYKK